MTQGAMYKVAMRLSELRPVMKAMKAMRVINSRAPAPVASFRAMGNYVESPMPAFRWTSPVTSLKKKVETSAMNFIKRKVNLKLPTGSINVPKTSDTPLLSWLHEAGHAQDPSFRSPGVNRGPLTLRDQLQSEVLASGNAMQHLGPAGAAEASPTLNANYRTYTTNSPMQHALAESRPFDKKRVGLMNAALPKVQNMDVHSAIPLLKSVRRHLSHISEPFSSHFKHIVYNHQDLLKQKF